MWPNPRIARPHDDRSIVLTDCCGVWTARSWTSMRRPAGSCSFQGCGSRCGLAGAR